VTRPVTTLSRERVRNQFVQRKKKNSTTTREQQRAVIGVLVVAIGMFLFLAIVSYDLRDEAGADLSPGDLLNIFSGDPLVKARADTVKNWLGLVGAVVSNFMIKETLGFAVLCVPIILVALGWTLLRGQQFRRLFKPFTFLLIAALLVSALFGTVRSVFGPDLLGMQWSGVVGEFLAVVLRQLLGAVGAILLLGIAVIVYVIVVTRFDIGFAIEHLREWSLRVMDWFTQHRGLRRERREGAMDDQNAVSSVHIKVSGEDEESEALPVGRRVRREESFDDGVPRQKRIRPQDEQESGEVTIEGVEPEPSTNIQEIQASVAGEIDYVFPSVDLLEAPRASKESVDEEELKANADLLRETLAEFDVELESVSVTPGPVVTLYELVPATGVKISRIVSLENDMALKLAAKGIRIMAPIPGRSAVGVEIPNHNRAIVTIRSVINSNQFRDTQAHLPLAMGKTISGEVFTDDLSKMPHLLIAGSTGSGKSVGINTILASLLYRMHPSTLKLVIIDPKKIELSQYAKLRHHFLAISPDVDEEIITSPRNAVLALKGVEFEMEKRYDRLAAAGVRNIVDYNQRFKAGRLKTTEGVMHAPMPFLVVLIDELADLMITAAREVEEPIARLAQLARAVGIHLVVATQRPSVDVITGVIKANFPARIAYQVASKIDSRTILDMNGAEQLLGNGDMLYLSGGTPKPVRLQSAFISAEEADAVVDHIAAQEGYAMPFALPSIVEKKRNESEGETGDRDELFEEAARLIVRHQQGSVSLLQRRLKVGYSRAARLVDELESAGVVGPFDGSKARDVLIESEVDLENLLKGI
jgi:S-DNA-T family DNA segregation ATPase FtsK/SpoIIIE